MSWRQKTISAALPNTYHQLAVLRGTRCSDTSRMGAASCRRWSNHLEIRKIMRIPGISVPSA